MQVFSPDGTAVRINQAAQDVLGIKHENHVGKYNVFQDPIVREQGIMDQVKQVLSGETVYLKDLAAPYKDMLKYFNVEDRDFQTLYLDITCFPLLKPDETLGCFIAIFLIKKIYRHRDEIQKAKEYIETHWREKYDAGETAKATNLSRNHFSQLFKKHMGMTPHDYYISVKIRNIQDRLKDESLTVRDALQTAALTIMGISRSYSRKKSGFRLPNIARRLVMENAMKNNGLSGRFHRKPFFKADLLTLYLSYPGISQVCYAVPLKQGWSGLNAADGKTACR